MWGCRKVFSNVLYRASPALVALTGAGNARAPTQTTQCDDKDDGASGLLRKRATLRQANRLLLSSRSTAKEIAKLRPQEAEIMQRWERDEDGWRELPARAWPAYQPDERQMQEIRQVAQSEGCFEEPNKSPCHQLLFQIATTLVFYNLDPQAGLEQFQKLARSGHIDAMVACGIILVEGLGVPPREQEGIDWLRKAVSRGSGQAYYELGALYYTGIDGVLEEDASKAFELFSQAAAKEQHTAAMYMMADCLVEGEGVDKNVAEAVPLFYRAAERGHRFARQRIRELLKRKTYRVDDNS